MFINPLNNNDYDAGYESGYNYGIEAERHRIIDTIFIRRLQGTPQELLQQVLDIINE